jgi:hypothetical protein
MQHILEEYSFDECSESAQIATYFLTSFFMTYLGVVILTCTKNNHNHCLILDCKIIK